MRVSVIIPCWNEAANLPRSIAAARGALPGAELIVACAESSDPTASLARDLADETVISQRPHRAAQLNLGASRAAGDLLLFLHADTFLPGKAGESLERAIEKGAVGGGFARRFDSPSVFLRITCLLAEARCRSFGWFLGDQAIFACAGTFRSLGGFRAWDRFEDLDFARRLRRSGRTATLRPPVLSSARRFEREGPALRTWRDFLLTLRYLRGDPAATLNPPRLINHAA